MGSDTGYVFGTNRIRTICEVLRDINDQFQGDNEEHRVARDIIVNSMLLSKRMISILARLKRGGERVALNSNEVMSDWLYSDNPAEYTEAARAIRGNPDYKVGGRYN